MTKPLPVPSEVIERIVGNCIEDGDCLLWQGAMSDGRMPVVWFEGKAQSVRRVLWRAQGRPLNPRGSIAPTVCKNDRCICPEHAEQVNRGTRPGRAVTLMARTNITNGRRQRSRLTWDEVLEIRFGDTPTKVLAEQKSMHISTIQRIRSGSRWPDLSSPYRALT